MLSAVAFNDWTVSYHLKGDIAGEQVVVMALVCFDLNDAALLSKPKLTRVIITQGLFSD